MVYFESAPRTYFDQIIKEMNDQGFKRLACMRMDSKRHRYHVPTLFSQHTRLFFNAPGKAMIVMLELVEHFGKWDGKKWDDAYRQVYWNGFICHYIDLSRAIQDHYINFLKAKYGEDYHRHDRDDALEDMFGISDLLDTTHFFWHGVASLDGVIYDQFQPKEAGYSLIEPRVLAAQFGAMRQKLDIFLGEKFPELQTTDFAPLYCFPESEFEFWRNFPQRQLRLLAHRIWGSQIYPSRKSA